MWCVFRVLLVQFGPIGAQGPSGGQVNTPSPISFYSVHSLKHICLSGPPGRPGVRGQPGGVGEKVNPPDVPAGNHKIWRNTHIILYMILNDRVKMESLVILDLLVFLAAP